MAREARKKSKSGNYYVVLKGDELFVTEEDKQRFREILEKNFASGIVRGCEFMKTEIRLVVKEGDRGISMMMKPVTTSYARYFNRTHDREGKLFLGRFRSEPLETEEEIEECLKMLKSEIPKKTAKRTVKKADKPKIENKPAVEPKKETKKNLPSWLL